MLLTHLIYVVNNFQPCGVIIIELVLVGGIWNLPSAIVRPNIKLGQITADELATALTKSAAEAGIVLSDVVDTDEDKKKTSTLADEIEEMREEDE